MAAYTHAQITLTCHATNTYTLVSTHTHTHTHADHAHISRHQYIHTCIDTHTHTHTHTHTQITLTNASLSFNTFKLLDLPDTVKDFFEITYKHPGALSPGMTCQLNIRLVSLNHTLATCILSYEHLCDLKHLKIVHNLS